MGLQLPVGEVTALLGSGLARRRVMAGLDEGGARTPAGNGVGVLRLTASPDDAVASRRAAISAAAQADVAIVLVDRLTDGLSGAERRVVLAALRDVAATGVAVLVDDVDPVATVAVADGVLRIDRARGLVLEPLGAEQLGEGYLAS